MIDTLVSCIMAMLPMAVGAQTVKGSDGLCPEIKIEAERLPDLNIPRSSHELFYVNGEIVVTGGHTNGFVPTPTAEYYRDGEWHQIPMVYNHDVGFSVVLKSGKILLGGGCDQPIGIGQTFLVELYDPVNHTFDGFGCLERKRTWASALEIDSGKVVISGNWYHDDGIEVYDGKKHFSYIKDATVSRSHPFILRVSKDDVIIFGPAGTKDEAISYVADRLKGDTIHIPLFDTWRPLSVAHGNTQSFIGDESKGIYSYLIPVQDSTGQIAIAKAENGDLSLLPTVCPIPMQSQTGPIFYSGPIVVDQKAGRGYMIGISDDFRSDPEKANRYYIVSIDYAQATEDKPAPLTLYYTDPMVTITEAPPVIDDNGNLLLAGGLLHHSNFTPSAEVWLLPLGKRQDLARGGFSPWLIAAVVIAVLALIAFIIYLLNHRRSGNKIPVEEEIQEQVDPDVTNGNYDELMQRICELMDTQKLYQNSDLKQSDIATLLNTNRSYISECINAKRNCSFAQFVNGFRVEHAKRLLQNNPDKKIAEIFIEAGFSNEQSFFRTFKSVTGMTPNEWKSSNNIKID